MSSSQYSNPLEKELQLPIPLGSFARVLVDYHPNWGIDTTSTGYLDELKEAEDSYIHEYATSTCSRTKIQSSVGVRSFNGELNERNALIVAALAYDLDGPINLVDFGGGAGTTTELAYMAMRKLWLERGRHLTDLQRRLHITFVEPSTGMMHDAVERLDRLGLRINFLNVAAHEVTNYIEPDSQDVCMEVAALHHYPNPQKPYRAAHVVTKPGGVFVVNEWCHSLFEHPLRFRKILEGLDWSTKQEDITRYNEFFGFDEDVIYPDENPIVTEVNRQVLEWYAQRFRRTVDYIFYTLEAHCPTNLILQHLKESRFVVDDELINKLISGGLVNNNPHKKLPGDPHASIVVVKQ